MPCFRVDKWRSKELTVDKIKTIVTDIAKDNIPPELKEGIVYKLIDKAYNSADGLNSLKDVSFYKYLAEDENIKKLLDDKLMGIPEVRDTIMKAKDEATKVEEKVNKVNIEYEELKGKLSGDLTKLKSMELLTYNGESLSYDKVESIYSQLETISNNPQELIKEKLKEIVGRDITDPAEQKKLILENLNGISDQLGISNILTPELNKYVLMSIIDGKSKELKSYLSSKVKTETKEIKGKLTAEYEKNGFPDLEEIESVLNGEKSFSDTKIVKDAQDRLKISITEALQDKFVEAKKNPTVNSIIDGIEGTDSSLEEIKTKAVENYEEYITEQLNSGAMGATYNELMAKKIAEVKDILNKKYENEETKLKEIMLSQTKEVLSNAKEILGKVPVAGEGLKDIIDEMGKGDIKTLSDLKSELNDKLTKIGETEKEKLLKELWKKVSEKLSETSEYFKLTADGELKIKAINETLTANLSTLKDKYIPQDITGKIKNVIGSDTLKAVESGDIEKIKKNVDITKLKAGLETAGLDKTVKKEILSKVLETAYDTLGKNSNLTDLSFYEYIGDKDKVQKLLTDEALKNPKVKEMLAIASKEKENISNKITKVETEYTKIMKTGQGLMYEGEQLKVEQIRNIENIVGSKEKLESKIKEELGITENISKGKLKEELLKNINSISEKLGITKYSNPETAKYILLGILDDKLESYKEKLIKGANYKEIENSLRDKVNIKDYGQTIYNLGMNYEISKVKESYKTVSNVKDSLSMYEEIGDNYISNYIGSVNELTNLKENNLIEFGNGETVNLLEGLKENGTPVTRDITGNDLYINPSLFKNDVRLRFDVELK